MKPIQRTIFGLVLITLANAGCYSSSAYDYAYYDPYAYYSYYPADVYYSTYYWSDPYYYYYLDYGGGGGGTTSTGAAGGTGTAITDAGANASDATAASGGGVISGRASQSIGDAIRALARGEDVCGTNAMVTPRMEASPCPTASGAAMVRSGATVVFSSCQLANGGMLDGMIDVQTMRTASDTTCGANTMINVTSTTTITNLSYTGPGGRRLVIPNQTGTGTTSYLNGQKPTTASTMLDGRMQVFDTKGGSLADKSYTGNITITPASDMSGYTIDGMLTLTDSDKSGTTTLTATGLKRTADCCRPTAGRVTITRTGQMSFGLHTFTFDSSTCGSARFDDKTVMLGACL